MICQPTHHATRHAVAVVAAAAAAAATAAKGLSEKSIPKNALATRTLFVSMGFIDLRHLVLPIVLWRSIWRKWSHLRVNFATV